MSTLKQKIAEIIKNAKKYSVAGIYWISEDRCFYCISEESRKNNVNTRIKFPGGDEIWDVKFSQYYFSLLRKILARTQFSLNAQMEIINLEKNRFHETNEFQRTLVIKFLEETGKYIGAFDEEWIWYQFVENNESEDHLKDVAKIFLRVKELWYEPNANENLPRATNTLLLKVEKIQQSNFHSPKREIKNTAYELDMSFFYQLTKSHLQPLPSFFEHIKEVNDFEEAVKSYLVHHYPKG